MKKKTKYISFKIALLMALIAVTIIPFILSCSSSSGNDNDSCEIDMQQKISGSLTDLTWRVYTTCQGTFNGLICFEGGNESLCSANILDTPSIDSKPVNGLTSSFKVDFILPAGAQRALFMYCDSGTISLATPHICSDGTTPKVMTKTIKTASPPTPTCDASYCGSISAQATVQYTYNGWSAYTYKGTLVLKFNPAPPAKMHILARLNGASISGDNWTTGGDTLNIEYSGDSVACQLTNPSQWVLTDIDHPIPVLAIIDFNWNTSAAGCPITKSENVLELEAEPSVAEQSDLYHGFYLDTMLF